MNELKHLLPPKLYEKLERSSINTIRQIITLSVWDIQKVTNLCYEDITLLKDIISEHARPKSCTAYELWQEKKVTKLASGCNDIDVILNGGYTIGSITEIYGESGSGKTQLALQAAAHNWPNSTVYICTEDRFPIRRFDEVKQGLPYYNSSIDYGSSTFVEHITESKDLLSCIRVRLPKLLIQKEFTLVVVDSVAAPFRVESTNYIQRAEDMREFAISLLNLAQKFNMAILCINQVTGSLDCGDLPALGLAWANMVSTRLSLKKTGKTINIDQANFKTHIRELEVIFAPDLPNKCVQFLITTNGLHGI